VFGVEFSVLEAPGAEIWHLAPIHPSEIKELCSGPLQGFTLGRGAQILLEETPLLLLAIPLPNIEGKNLAAVGIFVTYPGASPHEVRLALNLMGIDQAELYEGLCQQTPWPLSHLKRTAGLTLRYFLTEKRVDELETETQNLSVDLAATYEEITLLHRVAENLRLSATDRDLAELVLDRLQEVIVAEAVVLQLVGSQASGAGVSSDSEGLFLTRGKHLLEAEDFSHLICRLGLKGVARPVVLNRLVGQAEEWPFPQVRQLVITQIALGEHSYGFLAAVNHTQGKEFGTIEASLLSSIATLLAIHRANRDLYREQAELMAGVLRALISAIDAKDEYTCGHSDRVARIAVRIAQEMGRDSSELQSIYLAGLLHDIGKIGIDDSVLRKPGKLTPEEYEYIKQHVTIGYRILMDLKKLDGVLPVVLHHHEAWNGRGYPQNLAGQDIPIAARIVAVADAFDAMASDRPYRPRLPDEKIDAILKSGAGEQWDPEVIDIVLRIRDDLRQIVSENRVAVPLAISSGPAVMPPAHVTSNIS